MLLGERVVASRVGALCGCGDPGEREAECAHGQIADHLRRLARLVGRDPSLSYPSVLFVAAGKWVIGRGHAAERVVVLAAPLPLDLDRRERKADLEDLLALGH